MAATGSAVGLGNIWKFPYIAGEYGGGAFVLVYLGCILAVGIPVMMAEVMLGRAGRADPVHTMGGLAGAIGAHRHWHLLGMMGVLTGLLIMMFYSVVAGWALSYVLTSASGSYAGADAATIDANFTALRTNSGAQLVWHSAFVIMTAAVVAGGVTRGIGRAVETLMPLLFVLLLVVLGYSWAQGDFAAGMHFLFDMDFSRLNGKALLVALGHAFFTLSLGMGAIMTYGAYMPGRASIASTVLTIAALDTLIALIAGMAIFPLVFANGLPPSKGPGLLFISLPIAFANMSGGLAFGAVFFLLVSIAALSSSISLIEPGAAWLERRGIKRGYAAAGLATITWLGGVACIFWGVVFDALDAITARYMLPLGGLLIAIFAGWVMPDSRVMQEMAMKSPALYRIWRVTLRFVSPAGILLIFIALLYFGEL